MNQLILATSNDGKIQELNELLAPIQCISQSTLGISSAEETGLSFVENALIKARHASQFANSPALADDSGLVVRALNGEPGIYSARYAGDAASDEENIRKLLSAMSQYKDSAREAYFYCALALVTHGNDPTPLIATGLFRGVLVEECAGEGGFGYDPIFFVPEYNCTVAQLPAKIKNTISHRAKALEQLRQLMKSNQ